MVPRESAPVVVVVAVVVAAPSSTPLIVAPLMASVRLPVLVVVAEVLPLAALPDLALIGSSRPRLCPVFAPTMAPHR